MCGGRAVAVAQGPLELFVQATPHPVNTMYVGLLLCYSRLWSKSNRMSSGCRVFKAGHMMLLMHPIIEGEPQMDALVFLWWPSLRDRCTLDRGWNSMSARHCLHVGCVDLWVICSCLDAAPGIFF